MDCRVFAKVFSAIVFFTIIAFGQNRNVTYDSSGTVNPCTGEPVIKEYVTEYLAAAGGEQITINVLGLSKTWTDYNKMTLERSEFIHGAIALASQKCGSGGVMNLPATAATSTFQQTVFTNIAKPRMAATTRPSTQGHPKPLSKTTAAAATTTTSASPGSTPVNNDEEVTLPVATTSAEAAADQTAPVTPTETSTESGKAVDLKVAKKEAGTRPMLPPNNVTTDLEWNAFSLKKETGNNFALRAGYNRTLSNEKVTIGGTLVVNTMLMLDKIFYNNALNISSTYMMTETSSLERKIGGSINTFIVDKSFYGTPFGMSAVVSFSDNWFVNQDNIVTYGAMLQQSFVGDVKTTLATAGVLFGIPVLNRYAINPSCVLAYNLYTAGKNGKVTVTSPFMLQPAFNGSIYFTKLFSLDIGAKTTLFIKDYSDLILTIGTTVLF
jgi:hypothetical protein